MTTQTKLRRGGRRRANGEGTAYPIQTPAGPRWRMQVHDETGKRVDRLFATERLAREALRDVFRRKQEGRQAVPARHTMAQLFDTWLSDLSARVERGERSPNTWREYESYVRQHLRPSLGHRDCRQLTVKELEDYLAGLPLAPKTRHNHRIALRRALNVALKWGWVDRNVGSATDPIPVPRREVPALSLADAQRLLDALRSDLLYSAFVVALYTGLRAGELAGLRVEDVDLAAATAHVHQQVRLVKGHGLTIRPLKTFASAGRLDLIPEAVAVLSDAIGGRGSGYVWESAPDRPYWPTSIARGLTRAMERAGLPHLRLHDLRHYFVSFLPQLDVHPAVAQKLARHASIGTTMNIYTSVEDGLKKQAMGRLHDALTAPVEGATEGEAPEKLRILQ